MRYSTKLRVPAVLPCYLRFHNHLTSCGLVNLLLIGILTLSHWAQRILSINPTCQTFQQSWHCWHHILSKNSPGQVVFNWFNHNLPTHQTGRQLLRQVLVQRFTLKRGNGLKPNKNIRDFPIVLCRAYIGKINFHI